MKHARFLGLLGLNVVLAVTLPAAPATAGGPGNGCPGAECWSGSYLGSTQHRFISFATGELEHKSTSHPHSTFEPETCFSYESGETYTHICCVLD